MNAAPAPVLDGGAVAPDIVMVGNIAWTFRGIGTSEDYPYIYTVLHINIAESSVSFRRLNLRGSMLPRAEFTKKNKQLRETT
eukprot:COSAG02_NODE_14901_length_1224_cov_2.508444_1_plen_81_part_01